MAPVEVSVTPGKLICLTLTVLTLSLWLIADSLQELVGNSTWRHAHHPRDQQPPFPGEDPSHLHWFVQVSDLHISRYYDRARVSDFEHFCTDNLRTVIKPEVVLIGGDITDGKTVDRWGSRQYQDEWLAYHNTLHKTAVLNTSIWLDIRGNHDAFDVPNWNSPRNMFRQYSLQGPHHQQSYNYTHKTTDGDQYSFIAVDACLEPGPKRPFNFFGLVTQAALERLEQFRQESLHSNVTVWFGHYPTSTIASVDAGLRNTLRSGSVYMCGHLHTLAGLAPALYSRHRTGTLELELGDWKDNRRYRIFAVDHDLFSFSDEVYGVWPVVVVTNPKHGQFVMPKHEPTGRIVRSSHVRLLVFSNVTIQAVQVSVDGTDLGAAHAIDSGPLYVIPWNPQLYLTGLHSLQVLVQDSQGRQRRVEQPFSLDNTQIEFGLLPRFVLLGHHSALAKGLFAATFMATVLPLLVMKVARKHFSVAVSGYWKGCLAKLLQVWIRRLHLLTSADSIFYSLLGFAVYVAVGPWFIGELMTGHIGVCFVFGIWLEGVLVQPFLTYIYGSFQLLTFHIPLELYIGWCLDTELSRHKHQTVLCVRHWLLDSTVLLSLVSWQAYLAYSGIYPAYGVMAALVCPLRTWSIFLVLYLRWLVSRKGHAHSLNRLDHTDS